MLIINFVLLAPQSGIFASLQLDPKVPKPARHTISLSKGRRGSRLYKNFLFSTVRIPHACLATPVRQAIQAAPTQGPAPASVLLTNVPRWNPHFENQRNFYQADPTTSPSLLLGPTLNSFCCKTRQWTLCEGQWSDPEGKATQMLT